MTFILLSWNPFELIQGATGDDMSVEMWKMFGEPERHLIPPPIRGLLYHFTEVSITRLILSFMLLYPMISLQLLILFGLPAAFESDDDLLLLELLSSLSFRDLIVSCYSNTKAIHSQYQLLNDLNLPRLLTLKWPELRFSIPSLYFFFFRQMFYHTTVELHMHKKYSFQNVFFLLL